MAADVTILGGGTVAQTCSEVLAKAGIEVSRLSELDDTRCPVILGEVHGAFTIARQIVDAGRHLLITNPASYTIERLSLLLDKRRKAQALFLWNDRRYHPGYRFLGSLMEADSTWRPRFVRHQSFSVEPASASLMRWRILEGIALIESLVDSTPVSVSATAALNSFRNASDFVGLSLALEQTTAFLEVALSEPVERRETLIAADDRKAYIDELNQSVPVRLVEEERGYRNQGSARWVSCPAPSPEELVRQQCVTFLEATLQGSRAQDEAAVWGRSLAVVTATERSLHEGGASVDVELANNEPRFRLISGRFLAPQITSPSIPA